ncbi:MAG TPA: chromosomal replication initiator protein DnaA [Dehalococcoidia bacterium]|nr:chromosomal replication initiator protein DnaA [Dehalococcoidia bacterium]
MSSALPYSPAQVWEQTLAQIHLRVTRQNYDTWLRNTAGERFDGTTLVVSAANDLACDWLSTRMKAVISQSLTAVAGPGLQVRFETAQPQSGCSDSHPLQPLLVPDQSTAPINPRFRFETFLEADFNRLALTAAREIANGSDAYSPLYVTGPSGSGKTHLLHAIAQTAAANRTSYLLVNAEQFLSEFTTAIRANTGAAFRARYRSLDLLLIDDVHVLLGKKATLNEFYLTLAGLHDHGKRIVVAGDPSAAAGEATRFRSQLHWGLVASITQPSFEDRVQFVATKAAYLSVDLPDEVKHYLALRVRSSIRDLEGAVNRVTALARISKDKIDIDFAAAALQPAAAMPEPNEPCAPTLIVQTVCRHLSVEHEAIIGQKRDRSLTYARHLAMYLLRQHAGMSYSAIAYLMGKKDHSTVVHACSQIHKELQQSPSTRADIDAVMASINSSRHAA